MRTGFSRKEAREDGVSEAGVSEGRMGFSRKEAQEDGDGEGLKDAKFDEFHDIGLEISGV